MTFSSSLLRHSSREIGRYEPGLDISVLRGLGTTATTAVFRYHMTLVRARSAAPFSKTAPCRFKPLGTILIVQTNADPVLAYSAI